MTLTAGKLRELLEYDPETGIFIRKKSMRSDRIGKSAGCMQPTGYVIISVLCKPYLAHRLAWLYVNGTWPSGDIDHINRDKSDNRISNLRDVSRSENMGNATATKVSKTGMRGVHFAKHAGRYRAQIRDRGVMRSLGYFDTAADARAAYEAAAEGIYGVFPVLIEGRV